ncbi:MAG: FkbM family methyltransferase [Aureispira sp.]
MYKEQLLNNIKVVERIALASKVRRMLKHPLKYIDAVFFREFIYKRTKKEKEVTCNTFFDTPMHVFLPSSTDIYLTGGKSHDSEIRLARFLIQHLEPQDTFVDVGAHYGYFSLLAAKLVGTEGKVYSFEAAPTTYKILDKNQGLSNNITILNRAVSDEEADLVFYEFPNLYSEYNSLHIEQFDQEDWFEEYQPKAVTIKSIILDEFLAKENSVPTVIKIDVEGAEYKVIKGLQQSLTKHHPIVVLEYLSDERGNEAHKNAEALLQSLGYQAHLISKEGTVQPVASITQYLQAHQLDSDNIAFIKQ